MDWVTPVGFIRVAWQIVLLTVAWFSVPQFPVPLLKLWIPEDKERWRDPDLLSISPYLRQVLVPPDMKEAEDTRTYIQVNR